MKKITIESGKLGIEIWKLNRRGYYNFIKYIKKEDLKGIKKEFKGYEILNKLKGEDYIDIKL